MTAVAGEHLAAMHAAGEAAPHARGPRCWALLPPAPVRRCPNVVERAADGELCPEHAARLAGRVTSR